MGGSSYTIVDDDCHDSNCHCKCHKPEPKVVGVFGGRDTKMSEEAERAWEERESFKLLVVGWILIELMVAGIIWAWNAV